MIPRERAGIVPAFPGRGGTVRVWAWVGNACPGPVQPAGKAKNRAHSPLRNPAWLMTNPALRAPVPSGFVPRTG
jgi:hypothetical protein